MIPNGSGQALESLFINVNAYVLHYDFLLAAFPEEFPGLTQQDYLKLVTGGPDRPYLAGNLTEYKDGNNTYFGFSIWDDPAQPDTTITLSQAKHVFKQLEQRVELTPLVFVPYSSAQRDAAEDWDAPFPIQGIDSNLTYEPYTMGVGYGTLRLYDMEQFQDATESAEYGFQNILALSDAPFDVERVISGAVTGTRQGELSHLNVRSAARGTPNCYIANPLEALADWEDQLIRLECNESGWSVRSATWDEAEAFWDALKPDPVDLDTPDAHQVLTGLLTLDTTTVEARAAANRRYGPKGTNLATLYQRIDADLQLHGFVIPFAWYHEFVTTESWQVDLGSGLQSHTFQRPLSLVGGRFLYERCPRPT